MNVDFDSDVVNVRFYKKAGGTYTRIDNGSISIINGGATTLTDGTGTLWDGIAGSGKAEDNATKSRAFYQATAPVSPTTNDIWYDTDDIILYRWNGVSWDAIGKNASYITNTKITATTIESPTISGNTGKFSDIVYVGNAPNRLVIDGGNNRIQSESYSLGVGGFQLNGTGVGYFNTLHITTIFKCVCTN